ncbi:MAG: immunoglobulin domain-containing protein [Puniceicoccales bacterium]|nr:immunoglobulin domain-containing protein [Puniceicoccales bacterium]
MKKTLRFSICRFLTRAVPTLALAFAALTAALIATPITQAASTTQAPKNTVAAGYTHSLYVTASGDLYARGNNESGQLGDGTTTDRSTPVKVASGVASVAAGASHSLYVTTSGDLYAMGNNSSGQLGDPTTTYWSWSRSTPVKVASGVASVVTGDYYSLYITTSGDLYAMGDNGSGQLGDGTTTDRSTPVKVASGVASAVAGYTHSLYVTTSGDLYAMGNNEYGQLGDGTATDRSTPVKVASGVASVAAGYTHSMYVTASGDLYATGNNEYGQLGDGTTNNRLSYGKVASGVTSVVASGSSLYITTSGDLYAVGSNWSGQLGDGTTTDKLTPVKVASGVASVASGDGWTLYVTTSGDLYAVGSNYYGQLGDGTTTNRLIPVKVASGVASAVTSEDSYYSYSLYVTTSGDLYAMGSNQYRQNPTIPDPPVSSTPVKIASGLATPPSIFTQPVSQTANAGATATFSVSATGGGALSYQWYFDGTALTGKTAPTLTISSVTAANVGSYTVIVTNTTGSVSSSAATLTLRTPPSISTPPASQTVNAGETATFSVSAAGSGALSYQWYFGDTALTGETSSTLTISSVTAANAGSYTVIVTSATGSVTSPAATLTVNTDGNDDDDDDNNNGGGGVTAPVITADPADASAREGGAATFSATATGESRTYQWLHNGTVIEGETASTLTLRQVLLADAGTYQVRVTNAGGSDISEPATLTVTGYDIYGLTTKGAKFTAPKFNKNVRPLAPKTKQIFVWTVDYGDGNGEQVLTNKGKPVTAASYTAKADGHYTVYYRYTPIGATEPVTVLAADFGWVQVFPVLKFHKTEGLLITDQVTSVPSVKNGVVIAEGEFIGLTAKLETAPEVPVVYIWFDGKVAIHASEPTFSQTDYFLYTALTAKSKISVTVSTYATDAKGKSLSSVKSKTLAIKPILPPSVTITTAISNDGRVHVAAGKALSLKTKVTGTAKFTYQWQYRASAEAEWVTLTDSYAGTAANTISGAAKATLSIKATTPAASGEYRVIVTNSAGSTHAASAGVSVSVQ